MNQNTESLEHEESPEAIIDNQTLIRLVESTTDLHELKEEFRGIGSEWILNGNEGQPVIYASTGEGAEDIGVLDVAQKIEQYLTLRTTAPEEAKQVLEEIKAMLPPEAKHLFPVDAGEVSEVLQVDADPAETVSEIIDPHEGMSSTEARVVMDEQWSEIKDDFFKALSEVHSPDELKLLAGGYHAVPKMVTAGEEKEIRQFISLSTHTVTEDYNGVNRMPVGTKEEFMNLDLLPAQLAAALDVSDTMANLRHREVLALDSVNALADHVGSYLDGTRGFTFESGTDMTYSLEFRQWLREFLTNNGFANYDTMDEAERVDALNKLKQELLA